MNELKKIKDKLIDSNIKVRKKEKDLIVTEQLKHILDEADVYIVYF